MQATAIAQETYEEYMQQNNTVRRRRDIERNIIEIHLNPGYTLREIPLGYEIVEGGNRSGIVEVELQPGEKLHRVPIYKKDPVKKNIITKIIAGYGYIIQPPGSPTLSAKGVSKIIGRSIVWVHQLSRRGPLDPYGGLQGYTIAQDGIGFVPKSGTDDNGREVLFYSSDVEKWKEAYDTSRPKDEDRKRLMERKVPTGLFEFLRKLAEPEQKAVGYVTRTRVLKEAEALTHGMSTEQLRAIGLTKPVTDNDYDDIMAVMEQCQFGDHPLKKSTSTYRRKPRI